MPAPKSSPPRPSRKKNLLQHLHHAILPMRGNNHHPHILKREVVFCVLAVVIIIEVVVLAQGLVLFRNPNFMASVLPAVVADLTNTQRTDNNLQPLTLSPLLSEAAQDKANDMAAKGYFSHVSPDGTLPWHWFTAVGYDYTFAGENLAINFDDSNDVVNAWMASPEHRANILKGDYTQEGIGIATGMYQGHSTTFVVQFFAQPAGAATAESDTSGVAASASVAPAHHSVVATAVTDVRKVLEAPPPTELMTTTTEAESPIATAVPGASSLEAEDAQANPSTTEPAVLGIESTGPSNGSGSGQPSFFQTLLASPFSTANMIFVFIAALFISVLVTGLIYRKRLPRMTATIGGLGVVAVVLGFAVINTHFLSSNVQVDKVSVSNSTN